MNNNNNNNKLLVGLAFLSIYIVWGTTFLAIAYGLRGFPPFLLSGFRFAGAGLLLMTWLWWKGERPFSLLAWKRNAVSGLLILTVGVGSVTWAEQYISSTEAAIIIASEPFWFILLDKKNRAHYKENKLAVAGLIAGFLGLVLFFKSSLSGDGGHGTGHAEMRILSFGILICSALVWVLGSLNSKKTTGASLFMNVAQQLLSGGAAALVIASVRGEWQVIQWGGIPMESWLGLAYLIVFGSVIAYMAFIWLLSVKPPALVSTHTFVNPVVAVAAGIFVAGEQISTLQTIALTVIISGVILTNMVQYKLSKRAKVKIRKTTKTLWKAGQPYRPLAELQ